MKYVLVTGAYGGMGRKTVEALKRQGFCVLALDRRIGDDEEQVIPLQADITDPDSVRAAYDKARTVTDELYAILHFAGIYIMDSFVEMGEDRFANAMKVNLSGAFLVNKIFFPMLKKGSRIVITTSELAPIDPLPFTGIYAVTKGALDRYAYCLGMELQLLGISVSVLRAGAVATDMLGASTDELCKFCSGTELYSCNAKRFKKIVDSVEARHIPPEKIAKKALKILNAAHPKFAYSINRNPLLLLFDALPTRLQFWAIRTILKN